MDRNEFVSTLRAALTGEVSPAVVEDNVRYYQNYISQEIASGRREEDVMEELGDPRLIARTIIDTQGDGGYESSQTYYEEEPETPKGFHAEINDEGGVDIKYKKFNFNTWYGKLLVAVVILVGTNHRNLAPQPCVFQRLRSSLCHAAVHGKYQINLISGIDG